MVHLRRILKAFWFSAALSIILSLAIVATSVMDKTCPVFAAGTGDVSASPAVTASRTDEDLSLPAREVEEPPPAKVTGRVKPDKDADIAFENQKVKIHVPNGALDQEAEIEIIDYGGWGANSGLVNVFELNAFPVEDNVTKPDKKIEKFKKGLTISITHQPEDLAGFDTDTLQLCYLEKKGGQWLPVPGAEVDPKTSTLTATIDHFSYYGEVANPTILGPGKIMAYQVDLHSGAAISQYPIEVPAGSGGFQPTISLLYNSATVDEMKNKKSMGSWVGIGWALGLGSISYDDATGDYMLSLDGQSSYRMVLDASGTYHTDPESFFKITRAGQQWDVYDTAGVYYRFGGTADSQQYYDSSTYYRWDLSLVQDTNTANAATVTYVQDKWTDSSTGKTHVRAAYPTHVKYNNNLVDIVFNSTYDKTSGTEELRKDTPVSPKPKVAETRHLNSIEVRVSSSLVRKYVFTYTTTDDVYSSDYGGTYYAGKHKLVSITEIGADNTSTLPATTFSYADKRIYHYDDCDYEYTGNPGNPASLYWPYLTSVTNGFGATVTYAYTENPTVTSSLWHIWTREVVTSLTQNPGVGSSVTTQYAYTGDPHYLPRGPWQHAWDDVFKGFPKVRVTDAAGHYVDHYFYTTGTSDAETFSGKEYKTQYYSSSAVLLDTKEYTWACRYTDTEPTALGSGGVAYWKLDENTGQTLADSSGNGHSGTRGYDEDAQSSDPAWTSARYSAGLDFDGANDYARVETDSSLSLTGSLSLSAWVRRVSVNTEDCVIAYGTGSDILSYDHQYLLGFDRYEQDGNSYETVFAMGNSTYNGYYHIHQTNDAKITDADWHLVTVTFNSSTGTSIIYIDGVPKSTKTGTTGSRLTSGLDDGRIGSVAAGAKYFHGPTDDVRIYSRVLSPTEVADMAKWSIPFVYLEKETHTIGAKTSQTRYEYDAYGNVTKIYRDGDTSTTDDDSVAEMDYYPNTATTIDIGGGAIDRSGTVSSAGYTDIDMANPANANGEITSVSFWFDTQASGVRVGTYYLLSGNTFKCRDSATIGIVAADSKQTFTQDSSGNPLSLEVQTGDLIGWYVTGGVLEKDTSGTGIYYKSGEYIDPGDNATFTMISGYGVSIYGQSSGTSANLLSYVAAERVKDKDGYTRQETLYYYDGNNTSVTTPPTKGNLTRTEQKKGDGGSVSTYTTYDSYGNALTETDANGNVWQTAWESTYHTFPQTITAPITNPSQYETYSFNAGTGNLASRVDVNGETTAYEYDTFGRLVKVIEPDDSSTYPTVAYEYNNWGTLNQQHLKTRTKLSDTDYLWSSQYFDGFGRVIQTHAHGETDRTIIESTTVYNNRGLVDRAYVSQDLATSSVNGYKTPESGWKYSSSVYDGLGRATSTTGADGAIISTDYSTAWQQTVTNPRGYRHCYYYDAFGQLTKVEELDASHALYSTTTYAYDVLGSITEMVDDNSNTTTISYDWLSRKTSMSDPDMGSWTYAYDANGNLTSQTDAKGQTITMAYDALNRPTSKTYPAGSGMTNITYSYDSTAGSNYGKGRRTGMTDGSGTMAWKYDPRGRLIQETRTVDSVDYITGYTYDSADRVLTVTYPTNEVVTNTYNGRGLPSGVSGSVAGTLVDSTVYNQLGQVTRINLGNGTYSTFTYYGLDNSSGYYGKPWQTKTTKPNVGDLQSLTYTWDLNGNLTQRVNAITNETEDFTYDFLDRLTGVSGVYSNSFSYSTIGNITSMNGAYYTYGTKPHAVTAVGSTSYAYDANGNMVTRGSQTLTWNVENQLVGVSDNGTTMSAVYDGDGSRVEKTERGETVLYVNQYYEKNLTTSVVTTHYYLGIREVAYRKGTDVEYVCQDQLGSTVAISNSSGDLISKVAYFPFGGTRSTWNTPNTDKLFTGQRLDQTGLYYYGARYYDATIGRFVSADSVVQSLVNPQCLNRYSYCINNPLKLVDASGSSFSSAFRNAITTMKAGMAAMTNPAPVATAPASLTPEQLGSVANGAIAAAGTAGHLTSYGPYSSGYYIGPYTPPPKQKADPMSLVHTGLDVLGLFPGGGDVCDFINGSAYAMEGDWGNASLSWMACIPAFGTAVTGGKYVNKFADTVKAFKTGRAAVRVAWSATNGFPSFGALKRALGSAGSGKSWHHIVEKCQIGRSGFNPQLIHNPKNMIEV